jgi:hypothetical protein
MAATIKCDTIVNASSATNNLALDASGNVTVGAGLTLTGGALTVGGSVGTAGQILKSNGTTSSWVNGWTLINTTTVTGGAAIQDTTSLTSTYANYMIYVRNFLPSTNAVTVQMQLQIGGSYQTSGYLGNFLLGPTILAVTNGINLGYTSRNSNVYQSNYVFYINNPSTAGVYKPIIGMGGVYDTGGAQVYNTQSASMFTTNTNAVTGFQILASSGNISGTIQIYGSN